MTPTMNFARRNARLPAESQCRPESPDWLANRGDRQVGQDLERFTDGVAADQLDDRIRGTQHLGLEAGRPRDGRDDLLAPGRDRLECRGRREYRLRRRG